MSSRIADPAGSERSGSRSSAIASCARIRQVLRAHAQPPPADCALRYPDLMGLENPLHIILLLVVILLVFGAKRLPEIGRSLGEGLRGFKDSISGDSQQSLTSAPVAAPPAPAPATVAPTAAPAPPTVAPAAPLEDAASPSPTAG